jgi:thymidylate kinase
MIAFSGLDGSGKSTQIKLLQLFYLKSNKKVEILWSRGGYSPGMKFLKNVFKISKKTSKKERKERDDFRDKSFSNPHILNVWLIFSILDLILLYGLYIKLKELFGTKIICDRFIYDTLLDFQLNFPKQKVEKWFLWKLLLFVSVTPVKHFVITIPVIESQYRSKLKNEPFPDSKEVLESRLKKYLKYVSTNKNVIHIDGTVKIENIHFEIVKELKL